MRLIMANIIGCRMRWIPDPPTLLQDNVEISHYSQKELDQLSIHTTDHPQG
mgnify:CR=1 FL=1|jgi:hypothetical protein